MAKQKHGMAKQEDVMAKQKRLDKKNYYTIYNDDLNYYQ